MSLQLRVICDYCKKPFQEKGNWVILVIETTRVEGYWEREPGPKWKEIHFHKPCLEKYKKERAKKERALRLGLPFKGLKGEGDIGSKCPKCGDVLDGEYDSGCDGEEELHCNKCKARYVQYWVKTKWKEVRKNQ